MAAVGKPWRLELFDLSAVTSMSAAHIYPSVDAQHRETPFVETLAMSETIKLIGGPMDRFEVSRSYLRGVSQQPEMGYIDIPCDVSGARFRYLLEENGCFRYRGRIEGTPVRATRYPGR
jgi:hypothetical protein